ncbi:MAG TPA: c-type cytochrome, partial [Polyangiaceae bacterium]|nr:c-type cytochrome [Polyangiaceae bacterium]
PFVSVVDAGAERSLSRSVSRDPTIRAGECVLPRAAAFSASRGALLVACLGSDAVVELDARGIRMSRLELRRWQVPKGPTGIVVDAQKNRAVVWSQFDASISTLALDDAGALASISVPARKEHAMIADVAHGRLLFHAIGDKRLSKDGRACASCHPDGRDDALTWQTPDGARQTIMLAGRVDGTAPFSWSGKNATVEKHLESTLARLGGTGLGENDAADKRALLAYVRTLTPPPSGPAPLADRVLVARGEKLFDDAAQGCATCHAGGGTDHHAHEVDLQVVGARVGEAFDTPSLRFVGGTAPYFHDGRFATLDELLSSPDHAMGSSLHLSRDERVALSAYLETL